MVIDYTITYGESTGSYTELLTSIPSSPYTVTDLVAGITYKFKI